MATVENPAGPYGDYSGKFLVAESVTIKLDTGIKHEQHEVPSGLETNDESDDEEIATRYWAYADGSGDTAILSRRIACVIRDNEPFDKTVSMPLTMSHSLCHRHYIR